MSFTIEQLPKTASGFPKGTPPTTKNSLSCVPTREVLSQASAEYLSRSMVALAPHDWRDPVRTLQEIETKTKDQRLRGRPLPDLSDDAVAESE